MKDEYQKTLEGFYDDYNSIIKPLIALYEAREHKLATPILNEIRAFNDHVARCYLEPEDDAYIKKQLTAAGRHIKRLILDLYKYLIVSFQEEHKYFNRQIQNVSLALIDNGEFEKSYYERKNEPVQLVREAKITESTAKDDGIIYDAFEAAFNSYAAFD